MCCAPALIPDQLAALTRVGVVTAARMMVVVAWLNGGSRIQVVPASPETTQLPSGYGLVLLSRRVMPWLWGTAAKRRAMA